MHFAILIHFRHLDILSSATPPHSCVLHEGHQLRDVWVCLGSLLGVLNLVYPSISQEHGQPLYNLNALGAFLPQQIHGVHIVYAIPSAMF